MTGGVLGNKGGRRRDEVKAAFLEGAAAALPRLKKIALEGEDDGNAIRAADVMAKHGLTSEADDLASRPILVMGDVNLTQVTNG